MVSNTYRPDAIFATGDMAAISLIRAVKDLGMEIPSDLAVIGIDNIDISSQIDPPLTTIAQPFYEMGVLAANRLIERIRKNNCLEDYVRLIDPSIIIRKST
jgi:LacI family transcriptional regulator